MQDGGAACASVKIVAVATDLIEKRISMARVEGLTCLTWLDAAASSAEYEKCPLTYLELRDLTVRFSLTSDLEGHGDLQIPAVTFGSMQKSEQSNRAGYVELV